MEIIFQASLFAAPSLRRTPLADNYHTIPIDTIIVGERFRKDYGDITALVQSIQTYGLFHPIVVARTGDLLAGGRRLAACRALQRHEIPVHYIDEVDPLLLREIELEENLLREDLTWQEEALLVAEIDRLKRELHGSATSANNTPNSTARPPDETGWSLRRTATLTNTNVATVHTNLRLAHALEFVPSLAQQTSRTNALRELDRLISDIENELDRRQRDQAQLTAIESAVLCGDALELILTLADNSVDCIITDPPYGVDVGHGGGHRMEAGFDDSPEAAMALLRCIAPQLMRALKPSGHLYLFFAPVYWTQVMGILASAGFDVRETPCIWAKPGGATGTTDWDHNFAPSWEPFLFASNRERRLAFKRKNVFTYSVDLGNSRVHPTQKPVELLRELIQESTSGEDIVLDPFAGSGSTLVAASQLRRRYIGFEQSPRYHSIAIKRLFEEGKERSYVSKPEI